MLQLQKQVILLENENLKINNEKLNLTQEIDKYVNVLQFYIEKQDNNLSPNLNNILSPTQTSRTQSGNSNIENLEDT